MEPEFRGPWWLHPYFLYVVLTVVLFGFLLFMGWVAIQLDWIPNRGVPSS